jgi:hypothetical protein
MYLACHNVEISCVYVAQVPHDDLQQMSGRNGRSEQSKTGIGICECRRRKIRKLDLQQRAEGREEEKNLQSSYGAVACSKVYMAQDRCRKIYAAVGVTHDRDNARTWDGHLKTATVVMSYTAE